MNAWSPWLLVTCVALAACGGQDRHAAASSAPTSAPERSPVAAASPAESPNDGDANVARPSTSAVRRFDGSQLIEAYAAAQPRSVTQADALAAALFAAQTSLACETVRRDFGDDFAAHKNVGRYVARLARHARPMGYVSADLDVSLGTYDFGAKQYAIGSIYGDGSKTFGFSWHPGCEAPSAPTPDGSTAYQTVSLEADDGESLHALRIGPDEAERLKQSQYASKFSEHLVFYPVSIARGDDGAIRGVVHVTKMEVDRRPLASPADAPTILATRVFP